MNTVQHIHTPSRVQRLSFVSFGEEPKQPEPVVELKEVKVEAAPQAAPVEQPKLITEEELAAARSEGQAKGFKEGYAAAEAKLNKEAAKREEDIQSVLEVIANRITIAAEEHASYINGKQELFKNMVMGISRKIAGDAMKSEPYAAVEAVLRECLALIANEPKIIITVSEVLSAGLRQRVDGLRPLLQGFNGELVVEGSADVSENDCRVEWKNGYAEHDTAKLWNDIETIITRIGKL